MGAVEIIENYEELQDYKKVGSPFSIPKAALTLAGFAPEFSAENYASLEEHLKAFGAGLEITLLAAIPAGSGLGTSSILASTVLGAINDFCGLAWDRNDICSYTLALEQLLTTGGGWQDPSRLSRLPFALLHRHHPYSERNISRNRQLHVPQFRSAPQLISRDESTRNRHERGYSTW